MRCGHGYVHLADVYEVCVHQLETTLQDPAINQPEGTYTERKGIYQHPIIQKAINATWFANKVDEGVTFKQFFSPAISIETIALVLTAVRSLARFPCSADIDLQLVSVLHRRVGDREASIDQVHRGRVQEGVPVA